MSEGDSFLIRWARRKREQASVRAPMAGAVASPDPAPPVDLSRLPPLATVGPESDVSPFLAPGVPPDLKHAALRRAWNTDPRIREFVEVADNQWDFNAPDAMPGFGSLGDIESAKAWASRALLTPDDTLRSPDHTPPLTDDTLPLPHQTRSQLPVSSAAQDPVQPVDPTLFASAAEQSPSAPAPGSSQSHPAGEPAPPRRQHGGALPR